MTPEITTEILLLNLELPIAVVGNGVLSSPYGNEIDSYRSVIRFNNYQIQGFESLVGTKTTCRCTCGGPLVNRSKLPPEFTPFTRGSSGSTGVAWYENARGSALVAPETDVHALCPMLEFPSTGFSLVVLCHYLCIPVDVFGFDGFKTPEYFNLNAGGNRHNGVKEMEIIRSFPNVRVSS